MWDSLDEPGPARTPRLNSPRILIVGCGDVGTRVLALLGVRFRVFALTHSAERIAALRSAGAIPIHGDLDDPASLFRLAGLARTVVHLAPPPASGKLDLRTRRLVSALGRVERMVYVSTSGVYGDCQGEEIAETRRAAPATSRAERRVDAERVLRNWARESGARLTILRVPGIYARNRLPLSRICAQTPALTASQDVFTNHIHADDLARIVVAAVMRGAPQRVIHAVDDSVIKMGDWFDLVADAHSLPRPPRLSRDALAERLAPDLLSFMSESRRLSNARMKVELGVKLAYPTVADGLIATHI